MANILPFIQCETVFDNSTVRIIMGLAFDAACTVFDDAHLTNLAREIIAKRIIEVASEVNAVNRMPALWPGSSAELIEELRQVQ